MRLLRVKKSGFASAKRRELTLRNMAIEWDRYIELVSGYLNDHVTAINELGTIVEWHDEWVRYFNLPWWKRLFTRRPGR